MRLLYILVINEQPVMLIYEISVLSLVNLLEIENMPFLNQKLKRKKNK
jgi:hypothetical protein